MTEPKAGALTKEMNALRLYCIFLTGLHLVGASFYLLHPYFFIISLNWTTKVIPLEPHPVLAERFWSIMSASMMYMLTAIFFLVARDVRRNLSLLIVALVGKITSFPQFLFFFFFEHRSFAHLAGFVVDFLLFSTILFGYLRAKRSLKTQPA